MSVKKVPVLFLNDKFYHAYDDDAEDLEDAKKRARQLANKGNKVILKYLPITEANALTKKVEKQLDDLKKLKEKRDQCYREMQKERWIWGAYNMGWVQSHNELVAAYDKLHDEIYNYH